MNKHVKILLLVLAVWVFACNPNFTNDDILPDDNTNSSSQNNNQNTTGQGSTQSGNGAAIHPSCNLIAYSDTLFFLDNQNDDLKIKPLMKHDGEYGAYPEGLEINESHGEINVTKSESGLRYTVFFIPKNTKDTCFTHLTISGVDYLSKIYLLDKNEKIAAPIYNNNPAFAIPGVNTRTSEFDDDEDDDNGNGTLDEPLPGQQVIAQGLDISKIDGKIVLDNSIRKGLFGPSPKNGSTKKLKLFYRLDDKSGKALNRIELEFHYFENESDVPKSLKDKVLENQNSYYNLNSGLKYARIFRIFRKPRPPQIVIVGRNY
ncbi:hypothetical protein EGI22_11010 [Lacihabitans sp. LS3-19]|uniref:hypothetical protein n=1 Tax=Lacihabitans sp. LS3-19 TaxID=2487335 RepID=UPI0020CC7B28|nr:hypothetical protein [Lacihabitans sp. LS3-19]MCP9768444.1 hypothetical protein [Lacihabitans sp. LS3-19]